MATPLTYDNLPGGSAILREWKDGALTLMFPATEPGIDAIRRAARQSALSMLWLTSILFAMFAGVLLLAVRPGLVLDRVIRFPLIGLSVATAMGLFGLFWLDRHRALLETMRKALAEQTVLIASKESLGVQVSGSGREFSVVLKAEEIIVISRRPPGMRLHPGSLLIGVRNSQPIEILRGRSPAELEWVAKTLREMLLKC